MVPLALVVLVTVSQASVRCDETRRVVPKQLKAQVTAVRRTLSERHMKVVDLPPDAEKAYRLLEAQLRTHAWCGAEEQLRIVRESLEQRAPTKKAVATKALYEPTALAPTEDLPEKEISAGCPGIVKGKPPSVAQVLDQLGATLEKTQVRTIDIRRGPNLEDQLQTAVRLRDNPRAVKSACVLTYRASQVADGLDRAMARFQRVNKLRDERGVSEAEKPRFDDLVNQASNQVAARDYVAARATLETLLVFMGDPVKPSGTLPPRPLASSSSPR